MMTMTSITNAKKKTLTTIAVTGTVALLLTGCTPYSDDSANQSRIEDKAVTTMPQWDVRELVPGSWFVADGEEAPTNESETPNAASGLTNDVFLNNWVTLLDDDTSCRITGRVLHAPASMDGRGDDFNSRDYLYSMVPFESKLGKVSITDINEVPFVEMDKFTAPSEEGEAGWYHRAAARVFSAVLDIEGMTLEGDTDGANGSSLLQGVPVAYIDFSCKDEADLTEERWQAGLENFNLLFENPSEGPEETNTGEPVPAPAEDTVPPAEGDAPVEAPVETEGAPTEGN